VELRRTSSQRARPSSLIYRWDLDKTYLQTEFDSLRGLVKIPFEKAADKVAAPGVVTLMRGLRESARELGCEARVYFISASPPQIGKAIQKKLELDGIEYDGIVFKNQLQRIMRGKFRDLREQVGYKLNELLTAHGDDPPGSREYLFGDDWESDPLVYSLYADVVSGALDPAALSEILSAVRVDPALRSRAVELAGRLTPTDQVGRIFINLERRTPPARLRHFGARLVPTFNYLQTAACLHEEGVLGAAGFEAVARSLRNEFGYSDLRLVNSLRDLKRRGHSNPATALALEYGLGRAQLLPGADGWRLRLRELWERWRQRTSAGARERVRSVDYQAVIAESSDS
jgi:hypothetical protein